MDFLLLLVMFLVIGVWLFCVYWKVMKIKQKINFLIKSIFLFLQFIIQKISLFFPVQQKQVEIERVQKWLKMLKNWSKYRNSDRVSFTSRGWSFLWKSERALWCSSMEIQSDA